MDLPFLPSSFVRSLHVHHMILRQFTALYVAYYPEKHLRFFAFYSLLGRIDFLLKICAARKYSDMWIFKLQSLDILMLQKPKTNENR